METLRSAGLAALALLLALLVVLGPRMELPYSGMQHEAVRAVQWSDDVEFLVGIMKERKPVVIRNAPLNATWDVETLRAALPASLPKVCIGKAPTFLLYDSDRPLIKWGFAKLKLPYEVHESMGKSAVLDVLLNTSSTTSPRYLYYRNALNDTSTNMSELIDVGPFNVLQRLGKELKGGSSMTTNVWLTSANTTMRMHFDVSHNFIHQMHGKRRFILAPPTEQRNMHLFSSLHPAYRQSQVDFSRPLVSRFPRIRQLGVLPAALLQEGDTLYVPPFFFHHSVALTAGYGLNMYIPSKEGSLLRRLFQYNIPINKDWTDALKFSSTNVFLKVLIDEVQAGDVHGFKVGLLHDRYNHLDDDEVLDFGGPALPLAKDPEDFVSYYCEQYYGDPNELIDAAKQLAAGFRKLAEGVREIALAEYVESVAEVICSKSNMRSYITYCL